MAFTREEAQDIYNLVTGVLDAWIAGSDSRNS